MIAVLPKLFLNWCVDVNRVASRVASAREQMSFGMRFFGVEQMLDVVA